MQMDKFEDQLNELIQDFYIDGQDGDDVIKLQADIIALITPKLQWSNWMPVDSYYCKAGCQEFWILNVEDDVYHASSDMTKYQLDNFREFEGTLEECKQFCSDKILNDFLKLCE